MSEHGIYHYPGMTDLDVLRKHAIDDSITAPVTLHFHPYKDFGCEMGIKYRGSIYEGFPNHERYVDGKLEVTS